jgi:adenine-specific DNA-methyltransferase
MVEKIRPSFVVKDDRLAKLKELLPEAVADGSINWESLKESLAEFLEDADQEHFGLSWPGKREAKKMAFVPPKATLRPKKGEGVREEESGNLIIEGDNLEVLKLLQKSYFQSIKMIYIDPPYNTGNDFVYNDNFTDTIDDYMRKTGQLDAEGKALATNPKTSGRYHSNWLSMMYPRLSLAKNLLRDDGAIFVSIDDNEVHHLRQIMDEIFGEENFVCDISWQKKYSVSNNYKGIASIRDYILVFSRTSQFLPGLLPRTAESISRYQNPDNDPRGRWKAVDYWNMASVEDRPNLVYPITNPNTGKVISPDKKAWKFSRKVHEQNVIENKVWWGTDGKNIVPALKLFLSEAPDGMIAHNWWPHEEVGHTDEAKKEMDAIFDGASPFDTPKPTRLIKRMLQISTSAASAPLRETSSPDLILDFFAGSGTTAQAVLELNEEDGGDRKFIIVQIPEPTGRKDYPTIADITKERVRRVIAKLGRGEGRKAGAELFTADSAAPSTVYAAAAPASHDRGFRVYELAESNLKTWDPSKSTDLESLEKELELFTDPLKAGWKKEDLLVEVLLWEGFSLTSVMEKMKVGANSFVRVSDPEIPYRLFMCMDEKLSFTQKDLVALDIGGEDVVVFLDSSLTDSLKSKLSDMLRLKVV